MDDIECPYCHTKIQGGEVDLFSHINQCVTKTYIGEQFKCNICNFGQPHPKKLPTTFVQTTHKIFQKPRQGSKFKEPFLRAWSGL